MARRLGHARAKPAAPRPGHTGPTEGAERPEYGGADTPRWIAMLSGGGSLVGSELGILAALWATVRDAILAVRLRLRR